MSELDDVEIPDLLTMCPNCHGEARVWHEGVGSPEPCPECDGIGQVARPATPLLSEQITALRDQRERVAALAQTLSERELVGRILRLTIETEFQAAGKTKTDSEKLARADARYTDHEKRSIQLTFDQAVAEAHAEAARFEIELQLAVLQRVGVV